MKLLPVRVIGPRETGGRLGKSHAGITNTTSAESELSPFLLGPCKLWGEHVSNTMENAWQYSKVYEGYVDKDGDPSRKWEKWSQEGWRNLKAVRYPMGKGAKPLYSYWDGKKFDYISARLHIYIPLYAKLARRTVAFKKLRKQYESRAQLILWDWDGYDHLEFGRSLAEVAFDPRKKMGHAFVLAMLLENHPLITNL